MGRSTVPANVQGMPRRTALLVVLLAISAPPLTAQVRDRDARIPQSGELWIEVAPQFSSWHQQFALGSDLTADGKREPLYADFDGDIARRLFPGVDPLLVIVNRDAAALGFTPLGPGELAMGRLQFNTIDVLERRIPLGLQFGLGGFAAIEVSAPIVKTEVETAFVFDSAAAGLVRAETALSDAAAFFGGLDAAQLQLQAALDAGGLTPEDSALAVQLLADTEAFEQALGARIAEQDYLFTSGSTAGQQIGSRWGGFETGFQTFGIALPAFALPATASSADFDAYLTRDPVLGQPIGSTVRGYTIGEIDVGVRFKLIDTFGWPTRPPPTVPEDTTPARRYGPVDPETPVQEKPVEADSAAAGGAADAEDPGLVSEQAGDTAATEAQQADSPEPLHRSGLRFRTTVGARYRFPISDADRDPYLTPDLFLQQPIGDGQADLELDVYQDIGFGTRFWLVAGATYGIQMQDELVRRVAPPAQPFAMASQEVVVNRNLGDYLSVVVSPRFALGEALSLAVEYTYWRKGSDAYEVVDGNLDVTPLAVETSQRLHRLGIGAYYRTTRLFAAGRSGIPIDLAFVWETSIAGSGGQTPAASVTSASARVPLKLF